MRRLLIIPLALVAALAGAAVHRVQDQCGPFTDVSTLFCPYVLEAYYTGITAGTSPTTFSPDVPITRGQAAVFTTKALNQALARGSRRAALGQWWPSTAAGTLRIPIGSAPSFLASDGTDVWVTVNGDTVISRISASDGRTLESWTGAEGGSGLLVALGRIFVTGSFNPGRVYMLDPALPAGPVTTVVDNLGGAPQSIAFDGSRIWTANSTGSISIITPGLTVPWKSTTITTGLARPNGIVFDGTHMWVTDQDAGTLLELDSAGAILQTTPVGVGPGFPVFDGANIWVPVTGSDSVAVVRASSGELVSTLTGNGLRVPITAAFDGERILVTNDGQGTSPGVSLWTAADLSPIGFSPLPGTSPFGACSDGVNFWITLDQTPGAIVRF